MNTNPTEILALGPFGHAVARCLASMRPCVIIDEPATVGSGALVVASWRPAPALFDRVDEIGFATGKPFLPLLVDGTILRVGPAVVPGAGPCWHCWARRLAQHANRADPRIALENFYRTCEEGVGPHGYLEAFAVMAAARVCQVLTAVEADKPIAGEIWQMDMLTRKVTTSTAAGVHGCPRCGLHRPEPERSYAAMGEELREIWAAPVRSARGATA